MTNKQYYLFAGIVISIGLLGISCSTNLTSDVSATFTPLPATEISVTPSVAPSPTLLPLLAPTCPTPIPYPTASTVQANAVAFIGRDNSNSLDTSLWVANVDGTGERKLVEIAYNDKDGWTNNPLLQWSPDGKWISYIESHALYIISPDGSIKRKLLPLPDTREIFMYRWSPDSSKIAYLETVGGRSTVTPTPGPDNGMAPYLVGVIDIVAGNVSELSSFEANAGVPVLLWSPNGRDLLFIKDYSLVLLEVATRKVVKTIKRGCGLERGLSWSPNGEWFSYTDNGVGRYFRQWICVSELEGSNREIHVEGTVSTPVWDKTGNFLYFIARKTNPDSDPNLKIEEWLMRYDVRTQKAERLLPLREQQSYGYIGSVSISPDGNTLEIHTQTSESQIDYIFIDLKSFSVKNLTLDSICTWSADSENFICASQSNNYLTFYKFNIETKETNIFSGEHLVESWRISPIATTP